MGYWGFKVVVSVGNLVADPLVVDSKCWGGWLGRKIEIFGYFRFSSKRPFSYLRHNLPFIEAENDIRYGFDVKFDAESDGDVAGIPKPTYSDSEDFETDVQRFLRQFPRLFRLRGLEKLKEYCREVFQQSEVYITC